MRHFGLPLLAGGLLLLAAGCGTPSSGEGGDSRLLLRLPLSRQATDHTCGVAALQSILRYYGFFYREDVLARELHADDHAKASEIRRFAESLGFKVREYRDLSLAQLTAFLDRGMPVLVCMQAWAEAGTTTEQYCRCSDAGYWVVVIGYDRENLYVMDPSTHGTYAFVPRDEFLARWHDRDEQDREVVHFGMTFESPTPPVYRPDEITKME